MKYLGIFHSIQPIESGKILYAYPHMVEVIINYDETQPFRITHLSILVESTTRNNIPHVCYQVFEVDYYAQTDTEAIAFANTFAENILNMRRDLYEVFRRNHQV